jgi:hypothetical protein
VITLGGNLIFAQAKGGKQRGYCLQNQSANTRIPGVQRHEARGHTFLMEAPLVRSSNRKLDIIITSKYVVCRVSCREDVERLTDMAPMAGGSLRPIPWG